MDLRLNATRRRSEKFCVLYASASRLQDVYFLRLVFTSDGVGVVVGVIIVHSNDKMLFLKPNNYLSKFLWRAAHV